MTTTSTTSPSEPPTLGDVKLDPEDRYLLDAARWRITRRGAARYYCQDARGRLLQRVVLAAAPRRIVLFKNGNSLDCRRRNLDTADAAQAAARRRRPATNTSGYKGVCRAGRWFRARLRHQGRRIDLGLFHTAEAAARAYDREMVRVWGHQFAATNRKLGLLPPARGRKKAGPS